MTYTLLIKYILQKPFRMINKHDVYHHPSISELFHDKFSQRAHVVVMEGVAKTVNLKVLEFRGGQDKITVLVEEAEYSA